ncbi:MAG: zinc-ribbon domain containing protein [Ardenticatenaceae bacterium]|nr:zinc-ribbon domain containing protein [Ardenticatenaceae bacterium]
MTFRNDETIQCERCGRHFTWSYGEQRFYRANNLHRPKRCPTCRPIVNAEREAMRPGLPVLPTHPQPKLPSKKVPLPAERPSRWVNSRTRLNFVLGLLVVVAVVTLILLLRVLISG